MSLYTYIYTTSQYAVCQLYTFGSGTGMVCRGRKNMGGNASTHHTQKRSQDASKSPLTPQKYGGPEQKHSHSYVHLIKKNQTHTSASVSVRNTAMIQPPYTYKKHPLCIASSDILRAPLLILITGPFFPHALETGRSSRSEKQRRGIL